MNYSKTQKHFLDITIKDRPTEKLLTILYRKEIDRQCIFIENQSTLKFLYEAFPILSEIKKNMYQKGRFHKAI